MTIFELLQVSAVIAAGYSCGKLLSVRYTIAGWIAGFVLGCLSAIAVRWVLLTWLIHLENKWWPVRPPCKNGTCYAGDYVLIQVLDRGEATVYRCSCGTDYLRRERQFMELLEDGSTRPYMRKNKHGVWGRDIP